MKGGDDMSHRTYLYDSQTDARRARLTDIGSASVHRTRLIIRDDRGQGPVMFNRTYTTHAGARRALARRGNAWKCIRKNRWTF